MCVCVFVCSWQTVNGILDASHFTSFNKHTRLCLCVYTQLGGSSTKTFPINNIYSDIIFNFDWIFLSPFTQYFHLVPFSFVVLLFPCAVVRQFCLYLDIRSFNFGRSGKQREKGWRRMYRRKLFLWK